jgi:hypothetical protein
LLREGHYQNGLKNALWRDFHANGNVAAEGAYQQGKEAGQWQCWDEAGIPGGGQSPSSSGCQTAACHTEFVRALGEIAAKYWPPAQRVIM